MSVSLSDFGSLILYIVVLTVGAFFMGFSKKTTDVIGFLGLGLIIIFAAVRYRVGTDFVTYVRGFVRYSKIDWEVFLANFRFDSIFNAICKLAYSFGGRTFTWGTIAALIVVPIYVVIKKQYSDMNFFAAFTVFLFSFYTTSFNISREFIAVAIIFWSIKYVFENRFWKFAICVVLATMFHASAFVSAVLWVFWSHKRNAPISGGRKASLICIATVMVVGYQSLITFFSSTFSFFKDYAGFAEYSDRGQNRDFYVSLLVLAIVLFCRKRLKELDPRLGYMVSLLTVATLIGFTGFYHPHIKRIAYYFSVPAMVVIAGYLPSCKLRVDKNITTVIIYVYAVALFALTAYILGQGDLIPYQYRFH